MIEVKCTKAKGDVSKEMPLEVHKKKKREES